MIKQLADRSIRQLVGILEDVPIQVGKSVIPCDFIVLDIDESSRVPISLRRLFQTAAGAVIDVQADTISF